MTTRNELILKSLAAKGDWNVLKKEVHKAAGYQGTAEQAFTEWITKPENAHYYYSTQAEKNVRKGRMPMDEAAAILEEEMNGEPGEETEPPKKPNKTIEQLLAELMEAMNNGK